MAKHHTLSGGQRGKRPSTSCTCYPLDPLATVGLKINFPFCLFITISKTITFVRFKNSLV